MNTKMKTRLISLMICIVMLVGLMPTTAFAATTVNTINIKGITAPVAGEAPVITGITTDTAGITLPTIQWQKDGGVILNSSDKFEAGQTYNLWIRYAVSEGYEVSDAVTVTSDLENSTNDIDAARRIVHVWYTVPAAPKYTVTVTGGGTVDDKASVTTEAGTRLQLRAPEVSGKRFTGWSGLDGVTFYGDNAKVTDPILGFIMPAKNITVTANYQDAVEITTINIKGITKPLAGANPVNFGVTTDTTGLSVKEVIWYFDRTPSTNVPHDYEFQLGDKLYLLVFLDVADGYTFADPVTITADLEYTAAYRGLTYGTVYLEYTVTEEMPTTYTVTVTGGTASPAGPYTVDTEVIVTADPDPEGKKFKEWQIEGLSTTTSESRSIFFYMPANNVTITAIYEDANIIIESASATITVPVAGANPDFNIVSADESKYTVTVVKWNLLDGSSYPVLTAGDKFVRGESYQLDVKFVANPGYEFSDSCVYNVNGVPRAAYSLIKGERRCYFDVYEIIDTINVKGVVAPVAGAIPDVSGITSDTDGIKVMEVKWRDKDGYAFEGNSFVAGEKYILWLKYETESGYKVADDAEVTFNISDSNILDKEITHPIIKMTYEIPAASIPTTYTVSFDANSGTGTMTPVTGISGEYELPACTFTAPSGKKFKAWSVGGSEKAVGEKITVTADTTVTAVWETVKYTVTVIDGYGSGEYAAGDTVTIVADSPMTGKRFKEWVVGDGKVLRFAEGDITSSTAKFVMPGEAVRIYATYEDIPVPVTLDSIEVTTPPTKTEYTAGEIFDPAGMVVTATYSDNSTVPVTGFTVSPTGALEEGNTTITVTYTEEGVIKTATLDITVSAKKYSVTAETADGGKLTVSPEGGIREGETVTVKATPNDGYTLISMKVYDASGSFVCDVVGGSFTMPASNVTVRAEFEKELPHPVRVVFDATVILEGAELEAGAFSFELSYGGRVIQTLKNPADGKMTFAPIVFTSIGSDVFYIRQIKGSADFVEYDETVYAVTVNVTLNEDDDLVAEVIGDAIVFTNTYIAPEDTTAPEETTEEPEVTTAPEETTEEPEVTTAPEETTEEPEVTTAPEETTEEPEVTTAPEETTEEPEVTTAPEETAEEPEVTTVPEETTEEPEVTTVPEETQPENPKTSDNSVFIIIALIAITVFGAAFLACRKRED